MDLEDGVRACWEANTVMCSTWVGYCYVRLFGLFFFFFFQAEDGIRDTSVTGVQTCALPI